MRNIGIKSIAVIALFILTLIVVWNLGLIRPDRLRSLDPMVTFCIGIFTSIANVLFFKFLGLNKKSKYALRWGAETDQEDSDVVLFEREHYSARISRNDDLRAFDFSPTVMLSLYGFIFLCVGFIGFNNRGINLLEKFPSEMALTSNRYCPNEEEEQTEEDILKDPTKQGCLLVLRAYKLGYAKDLGTCAPDEEDEAEKEICTLRQYDEPYIHYAWRLMGQFFHGVGRLLSGDSIYRRTKRFDVQLDNLNQLYTFQKHTLQASPRSSHHIFTNLPHPDGWYGAIFRDVFDPGYCIDQFSTLPHSVRVDPDSEGASSKVLEHVYGHLLFHPRYKPTVAYCREYKIHWKSPEDTCEQLKKDPVATLKYFGIKSDVQTVIERYALKKDRKRIQQIFAKLEDPEKIKEREKRARKARKKKKKQGQVDTVKKPKARADRLDQVVSFACFMQDKDRKENSVRTANFKIFNLPFAFQEMRIPQGTSDQQVQVSTYKQFSGLLARGFHYGGFLSNESITVETSDEENQELIKADDYYFSRLEFLNNMDVFLGHDWVQKRADLMDVYPYYIHLDNFVQLFRNRYGFQRGRL